MDRMAGRRFAHAASLSSISALASSAALSALGSVVKTSSASVMAALLARLDEGCRPERIPALLEQLQIDELAHGGVTRRVGMREVAAVEVRMQRFGHVARGACDDGPVRDDRAL